MYSANGKASPFAFAFGRHVERANAREAIVLEQRLIVVFILGFRHDEGLHSVRKELYQPSTIGRSGSEADSELRW